MPASLGNLELIVLLAVSRLGDDAYGLSIRRDVSARTGRDYSVGAIYTTLERLEGKGLLTTRVTDPLPTRGGRSRRQFRINAAGKRAIAQAGRLSRRVWDGVGDLTPEPS